MTQRINLPDFVRGDLWSNKATFTNDGGAPRDITGWTFWLTLKLDPTAADVDAAAQTVVVASGADALNGIVHLVLTSAQTEVLLPTGYSYDIQFSETGSDDVRTLSLGRVRVIGDVTRSR